MYYEVLPADGRYKSDSPLTYSYDGVIRPLCVVTIPLRSRLVTGFVVAKVSKPKFDAKPIKSVVSPVPLPAASLKLAEWMADYYHAGLGDVLKQFAPSKPSVRQIQSDNPPLDQELQLELNQPLSKDQKSALTAIKKHPGTTILLHGDTGTGKTRVYLELAEAILKNNRSVILLTPEISLTSQLARAARKKLSAPTHVIHSQLSMSQRKKIWLAILEAKEPIVIIGPRSALFSPVKNLGLIVLDEAHEPAYKQEQSPRYHARAVASHLGTLTGAKVILGTATPLLGDYYLADKHKAVVRMSQLAAGDSYGKLTSLVVDMRRKENLSRYPLLSKALVEEIKSALARKKQVLIYLNRRGTARLILCTSCGWQLLCPNCDIPLVYHGDEHLARCHTCGHKASPPVACPQCKNPDIIYKGIGTKALEQAIAGIFPDRKIQRFDSDNIPGERINELYSKLLAGEIDILVGTQLLAKGFDLPRLGMVGIISAESSMSLPDYSSEERSFQLLYQVMGRVGRGHGAGTVVLQSYSPDSKAIRAAIDRDWNLFYEQALKQRQQYRFPPYSYLLQLVCKRVTIKGAQMASQRLKSKLLEQKLPVEIIGPTPNFFGKRGSNYYYQLVVKSKQREHLLKLAASAPADWTVNLDPQDLL